MGSRRTPPGVCRCDAGWHGTACDRFDARSQAVRCPRGCSGHGSCIRGRCVCDTGFHGEHCGFLLLSAQCKLGCSGRGACRVASEAFGPLPGVHNEHWLPWRLLGDDGRWRPAPERRRNQCICHDGSSGPSCSIGLSEAPGCPSACSGHGLCREGGCECEAGYGGNDCGVVCEGGCSGHGRCTDEGRCSCEPGYWGRRCERGPSACKNGCSNRGRCAPSDRLEEERAAAKAANAAADQAKREASSAVTSVASANAFARAAEEEATRLSALAVDAAKPRCHCLRGWGRWGANRTYSYDHDCSQPDTSDEGCPVGCNEERSGGKCVRGACVCAHGFSGPNCATDALAARHAMLRKHNLVGVEVPRGTPHESDAYRYVGDL